MIKTFLLLFISSLVSSAPRGSPEREPASSPPPAAEDSSPPPTQAPPLASDYPLASDIIKQLEDIYKDPSEPKCHNVEKIEFVDQCEQFTEKTCFTQSQETCVEEIYKNCTGVILTNLERSCFKVQEIMCSLKEHVHYDSVDETYKVSKCTNVKDRVCDTIYNSKVMTKDDYQCLELETPRCHVEEKEIMEEICKYSTEFDCSKEARDDPDGYADKATVCKAKPTTHCYEVPRMLREEVCTQEMLRYCEKFSNEYPYPVERQNCHFDRRRICEVQSRKRVKKAKRYSYSQDCSPVSREVCDSSEKKLLVPTCDDVTRFKCTYEPVETCNEEDKEYCHKVEKIVIQEVCEEKLALSYL